MAESSQSAPRIAPELRAAQKAREVEFNYPIDEQDTAERFELLRRRESLLVAPELRVDDYRDGTARYAGELLVIRTTSLVLVSAEHAVDHYRQRKHDAGRYCREADYGTAALALTTYEATGAAVVMTLGKDVGDANDDEAHPLKDVIAERISDGLSRVHISIHGMARGRISDPTDYRGYHVLIGVGSNPTEETRYIAERAQRLGEEFDLRVGINAPVLREHSPGTITFAASGAGTTRAFAERVARERGTPFAALQFELTGSGRVMPLDYDMSLDERDQRVGTYVISEYMREVVEMAEGIAV